MVVDNGRTERKGEERASLLQNEVTDSWGDDDWDKKEEVNDKIEQWRNSNAQVNSKAGTIHTIYTVFYLISETGHPHQTR